MNLPPLTHRSDGRRIVRNSSDEQESGVLARLDAVRRSKTEEPVFQRVVRKKKGHAEHHGSAWKVAFADFCLALLALFLVLWLLAAREQERLQVILKSSSMIQEGIGRKVETSGGPRGSLISREPMPSRGDRIAKRSLASGDQDPAGPGNGIRVSKTLYESRADMAELAKILKQLSERAGLVGNVETLITPYGLRVMLHDTDRRGMFELGSANASDRFGDLLKKIGPLFAHIENQIVIAGHTDSLQYSARGPAAMSNWQLSSERAMTARTLLLAGGMPPTSVLQVVGLADSAPLNVKNPAASENRRIEMLVLTKAQASTISAMFGAPEATLPLIDGVDVSVPRDSIRGQTLDELRSQTTVTEQ
jgi:chemotaxis protein MotB